jgi:YbbR domain-containing protein
MNRLKAVFLHNLSLKALSLFLAVLLWMQVSGQETVQRIVSVPLVFVNVPPDLEIAGDYETKVDVVIRAERPSTPIQESQFAMIVDLSSAQAGEQVIALSERNVVQKPLGVEILNVLKSRIRLTLERILTRTVEVQAELTGQPAAGFRVVEVLVSPSSITLVGPETSLRRIETLSTDPVDISDAQEPVTKRTYLDLNDQRVRIEGPEEIQVTAVIQPVPESELPTAPPQRR